MNIPEGYQLVPIQLTEEMERNMRATMLLGAGLQDIWADALCVAPAPTVPAVEWGSPKTVRQLISQLETMDQDLPVKSAFRIRFQDGTDKVAAQHVIMSYEQAGPRWLGKAEDSRRVLMFWVKPDDRLPVTLDLPEYHEQGMGCGLEDRDITDRYEACRYGFEQALESMAQIIENAGPLYDQPDQSEIHALRLLVESGEQVAEHLSRQIDIVTINSDAARMRVERMTEALELVATLRGTLEQHGMLQKVEEALGRDEQPQEAE